MTNKNLMRRTELAELTGELVKPKQSMKTLPVIRVKGNEVIFKDGNSIVDRCSLDKFRKALSECGLDYMAGQLEIADRSMVDKKVGNNTARNMIYDWRKDEQEYMVLSASDKLNHLELIGEERANDLISRIHARMDKQRKLESK